MWASQLLTITASHRIHFGFNRGPDYTGPGVHRVEVVLFNCPQWGIATDSISVLGIEDTVFTYNTNKAITITSCDYLVKVCLSLNTMIPNIKMEFSRPSGSHWVHLAEVTFYGSNSTCPPDSVLDHQLFSPPPTQPSAVTPPPPVILPPTTSLSPSPTAVSSTYNTNATLSLPPTTLPPPVVSSSYTNHPASPSLTSPAPTPETNSEV